MANFIITTQKPTSSELQASKSKTAGQGMEDAFDSLMSHKEINPSRPVGDQDGHRGHDRQQHQQQAKHQDGHHDVKRTREQALMQHPRHVTAHMLRHAAHTIQPVEISPGELVQRKMQDSESGDQGQQQQQRQQQKAKVLKGKGQKNSISLNQDLVSSDRPSLDLERESEQELGSVFDDLELTGEAFDEPALLADDQSIFDMLGGQEDVWQRHQSATSVLKERIQVQIKPGHIPGQDTDFALEQKKSGPTGSGEENQLLAAALAKTSDHYPEGSVGRALRDGKLSQESLHKLFAQWKAHQEHQHKGHQHGRGVHIPHVKSDGILVPTLNADQELTEHKSSDEESRQSSASLSEAVEKIYEYIQEQIVESVWVAQSPHALAEGIVVILSGDLVGGSRFLVRKNQDKIEVTFYIENEAFYTMAQGFEDNLALAIQKKCDADSVQIRYHRINARDVSNVQTMSPSSMPSESDDDLWGG